MNLVCVFIGDSYVEPIYKDYNTKVIETVRTASRQYIEILDDLGDDEFSKLVSNVDSYSALAPEGDEAAVLVIDKDTRVLKLMFTCDIIASLELRNMYEVCNPNKYGAEFTVQTIDDPIFIKHQMDLKTSICRMGK